MAKEIMRGFPQKIIIFFLFVLTLAGILARLYHITENQFIYYDEGMWLNNQRDFVSLIERNPPQSFNDWKKILEISIHMSLVTDKALWSFFAMLRGLFVGAEGWYFTRLISSISGILTLGVTYLFANKFFKSHVTAALATAILALMPSHVYYSRIGLQEGFSTLCFLLGMYFYFFPRKFSFRNILSGVFFACVFFSNYRMIIIPFLVVFCEAYISLYRKELPQGRKFIYSMLTFLMIIFLIGGIDNGANTKVTFGWMFHQANLAEGSFDVFNLLSYPYYLFRLESFLFGLLFFGNIYFFVKRDWHKLMPFLLSLLVMVVFSFAQEKGVRYVCAVMPFMAMAVAALIVSLWREKRDIAFKAMVMLAVLAMFGMHAFKGYEILNFHTDYEASMNDLLEESPNAKILSTQNNIQELYVDDYKDVLEPPGEFKYLLAYYFKGFEYLVIDPQAYISFTEGQERFTPKLKGYMDFIQQNVPAHKTYPHFNGPLLERFVLEHNVNLKKSLDFLKLNESGRFGELKVYDLTKSIKAVRHFLNLSNQMKIEEGF